MSSISEAEPEGDGRSSSCSLARTSSINWCTRLFKEPPLSASSRAPSSSRSRDASAARRAAASARRAAACASSAVFRSSSALFTRLRSSAFEMTTPSSSRSSPEMPRLWSQAFSAASASAPTLSLFDLCSDALPFMPEMATTSWHFLIVARSRRHSSSNRLRWSLSTSLCISRQPLVSQRMMHSACRRRYSSAGTPAVAPLALAARARSSSMLAQLEGDATLGNSLAQWSWKLSATCKALSNAEFSMTIARYTLPPALFALSLTKSWISSPGTAKYRCEFVREAQSWSC
mmetsp:Transcript_26608/g.58429  ORF Transcript_26608/g.58429 Transcript_26608/m.58429 type:complete len:289 (+) Transcript_26608:976-1842(+)